MAESNLSLTLWDLRQEVARFLGIGNSYMTGTVSVSSTTATLSGGKWPSWAAGVTLVNKADGTERTVSTRDSDTQLTLTSSATWSSVSYEINPWDAEQTETLTAIIKEGYRRFLNPPLTQNRKRNREWSFLSPIATLSLNAPYSTGTITVSSGVVTLSGGTFPSWAAAGEIYFTSGSNSLRYEVSTRDSATQLTLTDTSVNAASGTKYSLENSTYALPDGFAGMMSQGFTFQPGGPINTGIIRVVGEEQIRVKQADGRYSGTPTMCCIRPVAHTGSTGQRYEVIFYPTPDAARTLWYRYRVIPDMMTAANPYPLGGMHHGTTLMESCLAVAEERINDTSNLHRSKFQEQLMSAVDLDERMSSPTTLGLDSQQLQWGQPLGGQLMTRWNYSYNSNFFTS
jgi:hypothetical protein